MTFVQNFYSRFFYDQLNAAIVKKNVVLYNDRTLVHTVYNRKYLWWNIQEHNLGGQPCTIFEGNKQKAKIKDGHHKCLI